MTEDLDRILVSEESITPSDGFLASVMEAVRECHRYEMPLPFPWGRFVGGLVGALCCTVLSTVLLAPKLPQLHILDKEAWTAIPPLLCAPEIVCTLIVLVGSLLAIHFSVTLTAE